MLLCISVARLWHQSQRLPCGRLQALTWHRTPENSPHPELRQKEQSWVMFLCFLWLYVLSILQWNFSKQLFSLSKSKGCQTHKNIFHITTFSQMAESPRPLWRVNHHRQKRINSLNIIKTHNKLHILSHIPVPVRPGKRPSLVSVSTFPLRMSAGFHTNPTWPYLPSLLSLWHQSVLL